jgi:hypothetical protein
MIFLSFFRQTVLFYLAVAHKWRPPYAFLVHHSRNDLANKRVHGSHDVTKQIKNKQNITKYKIFPFL